jgi:hypothetical protein
MHVFKHQIDQIITYLSWGQEWAGESDGSRLRKSYDVGGAETLGHVLACWLAHVAHCKGCETAVGRDMLFTDTLQPREPKQVMKLIREYLAAADVEVVEA